MSYSYIGKFVDVKNHRHIINSDISILKNLNELSYSCSLRGIEPTGTAKSDDYPELTRETVYSYVSQYHSEILKDENLSKFLSAYYKKDWNNELDAYYVEEDALEQNADAFVKYSVIDGETDGEADGEYVSADYVLIYVKKIRKVDGAWYRKEDFEHAESKIKSQYFEKYDELKKLKSLRNTKDWFEMSEEARNNYFSEVDYLEEALEEAEWSYNAITYILNVFSFLEDEGRVELNEYGEENWIWSYDDKRKIEVFIEVC